MICDSYVEDATLEDATLEDATLEEDLLSVRHAAAAHCQQD